MVIWVLDVTQDVRSFARQARKVRDLDISTMLNAHVHHIHEWERLRGLWGKKRWNFCCAVNDFGECYHHAPSTYSTTFLS